MNRFLTLAAAALLVVCCSSAPGRTLPCDLYREGGTPCVAAHSTTRLLNSAYRGPLYQVVRESDGRTLDVRAGKDGYADVAPQDAFCEETVGWISIIYDQSGMGNDLLPAPPGTFSGPDKGGFNTRAIADMAPALLDGHKVYGLYIMPGMGYRCNDARGLAVGDEPEGIYYVIDGQHFDSGCCFDYGNSSTNGRAVGTGTMETTYYGTATAWGRGNGDGPWIMSDMEAGLFSGYDAKQNDVPSITDWRFVSVFVNGGGGNRWDLRGGDASCDTLTTFYSGVRPGTPGSDAYYPMHKKGGLLLGNGGDNGNGSAGTFFEGVMTVGYPTDETIAAVQADIASRAYRAYPLSLSRITSVTPGAETTVSVTFENTTGQAVQGLSLKASLPKGWRISDGGDLPASIAPDGRVTVNYTLTAPAVRASGEIRITAGWAGGSADISRRIRCAEAVKINEILLSGEQPFIELYNAGADEVDLSGFELVLRRSGQAAVRALALPKGTRLAPGAFLVLEQAPGSVPAPTTIFIPVSTGPVLTFPAGTETLPATSMTRIEVGRKLGIGLGDRYELVTVTQVGTPATQTNLSRSSTAGDNLLFLDNTVDLKAGQELTVDTGTRKEIAIIQEVLVSARKQARRFGPPVPGIEEIPPAQGLVQLAEPLQLDHAEGVDASSPGTGIGFLPATRFAHESGGALQPFETEPEGLYATGEPDEGFVFRYALSTSAGSVSLVDPGSGTVVDALVYGSQQSNSSANGTIASPELATLEGDQRAGGCIAVVPQPRPAWMSLPAGEAAVLVCLVRRPDGADADQLCEDFRLTDQPTPGSANQ